MSNYPKPYNAFLALLCLLALTLAGAAQRVERSTGYSAAGPVLEPLVFAPGVISTAEYDTHPAFTPDGKTLYFLRSTPNFGFWTIMVSEFIKGRWMAPNVAPFSGQYSDADPYITPDGSRLYFISTRPIAPGAATNLDIWYMDKTATGWSEPKNPGSPINSPGSEWYPTIAANGTIYFGSDREGGKGRNDIYRSPLVDGKYAPAENLGAVINTQANEFEPWIAPDESYLIFMCGGRAGARGGFDLYISYNRKGEWSNPVNLGDKINSSGNEYSPMISPDGKYFFWGSTRGFADKPLAQRLTTNDLMTKLRSAGNGLGDIYQIDISELKIEK